jgi:hypothetical protein
VHAGLHPTYELRESTLVSRQRLLDE